MTRVASTTLRDRGALASSNSGGSSFANHTQRMISLGIGVRRTAGYTPGSSLGDRVKLGLALRTRRIC